MRGIACRWSNHIYKFVCGKRELRKISTRVNSVMKTAFHPFKRPTVNPDATGKLDAAMAYLESRGGFQSGDTLNGIAKQFGVHANNLRYRLRKAGMATPGELSGFSRAPGITPAPPVPLPVPSIYNNPDKNACEMQVIENEGANESGEPESGNKVQSAYNLQSVCTLEHTNLAPVTGIDRSQIPVLQETEVDRHDEEVARLVRDSLDAFRKGKSKGPGGRRVIPIQKVSDLTALDTLFRRATRQGERSGGETSRPILNIQFLGSASRESVRVAKDDTSRIVDVQGEADET